VTHNPKTEGLNPKAGNVREKMGEKLLLVSCL
jgi:hypothetical protein